MLARFDVSHSQIAAVVRAFYAKVRLDPVLGSVFAAHVTDWPAHETKIAAFWGNAILLERGYDGNPMQAHLRAGDVKPEHFTRWLMLFDTVLAQELPTELASKWSHLAHRIGRGLRAGLEYSSAAEGAAPILRG